MDELALAFQARLAQLGVDATREEVVMIVQGQAPTGMVTTLVEAWVEAERKRGVEIV